MSTYKMSKGNKCCDSFSEPKVMCLSCSICQTNSPKSRYVSFAVTFEKLEPAHI